MRTDTRTVLFVAPLVAVPSLAVLYTYLNKRKVFIDWLGINEPPFDANAFNIVFCLVLLAATAACWLAAFRGFSRRWRLIGVVFFAILSVMFFRKFVYYNTWL
jgi:hypothetical protein